MTFVSEHFQRGIFVIAHANTQHAQDVVAIPGFVTVVSKGKEAPFCTEQTEVCWQQNRRAHFVLQ